VGGHGWGRGKIWGKFLAIIETVEKPVLMHYGSYETTFLKRMRERYGKPPAGSVAAGAIQGGMNLLSVIFAQVYFPTFSNGLKEIARALVSVVRLGRERDSNRCLATRWEHQTVCHETSAYHLQC